MAEEVPSLRVYRVDQTYRRPGGVDLDPHVEAWEYGDERYGPFRIEADADGLVVDYEGFAQRVQQPVGGLSLD